MYGMNTYKIGMIFDHDFYGEHILCSPKKGFACLISLQTGYAFKDMIEVENIKEITPQEFRIINGNRTKYWIFQP